MRLPCQFIMVECKNYTSDPANPELDQLSGRFSPNRGRVGLLLSRSFTNFERFIDRCRDTYEDDRGLIIPLTDEDIISLLNDYDNWNANFLDKFLSDRIRLIAIN